MRKLGHRAFSCDIIECSGGHPEWHIKGDVLPILNGRCKFRTMDGMEHVLTDEWDMIIAHPPCTYLTVTGNRWFNVDKYGDKAGERIRKREEAARFFGAIALARCKRIVIENPIGYMSTAWRKPNQIIHPYYFAEHEDDENCERKATCLWFVGDVEPLKYEIKFEPRVIKYKNGKGTDSPWHVNTMSLPPAERAKARSRTFPGIAKAFAEQWAGRIDDEQHDQRQNSGRY